VAGKFGSSAGEVIAEARVRARAEGTSRIWEERLFAALLASPDSGPLLVGDLLADGDAGGAPGGEVLAVPAADAVAALAHQGQRTRDGLVALGGGQIAADGADRPTAGEVVEADDPDGGRAVLRHRPVGQLDPVVPVGHHPEELAPH
jgi:hypothetical protein